jgi:glutamate dehydrogenase (NAD(P)+)
MSRLLLPVSALPDGPSLRVEVVDDRLGPLGYVVIDRTVRGVASGGVRLAPDVSQEELSALARSMTYKWAFLSLPLGGAKGGIRAEAGLQGAEREAVMHAFGKAIAPLVRSRVYLPGIDLGTTLEDLRAIMGGAGQPLPSAQIDGSLCTALTVFECIRQVARFSGRELTGLTVALEGFGKVGSHLAQLLDRAGARLLALSTADGMVTDPGGLDVPLLLRLKAVHGDALVNHLEGRTRHPAEQLVTEPADVLVPGARPWVIREDNVDRVQARWIVPIANAPITPQAEVRLADRQVVVVPDFVANCGGIFSGELLANGFGIDDGRAMIEDEYAQLLVGLLGQAARSGRRLADEARALAWRRHLTLDGASASRASPGARLFGLLQAEGTDGIRKRAAWRIHRWWPQANGAIRAVAAERLADMTIGRTRQDLLDAEPRDSAAAREAGVR